MGSEKGGARMKPVDCGLYEFGLRRVRVIAVSGEEGGHFSVMPEDGISKIQVSLGYGQWARVVEVLLHEAMEMALYDVRARYNPNPDWSNSNDVYLFVVNHANFAEACSRAGYLLSQVLPKLSALYKKRKNR